MKAGLSDHVWNVEELVSLLTESEAKSAGRTRKNPPSWVSMAGMENFVLRTLAALVSSLLVFYLDLNLSVYVCVEWEKIFPRHYTPGLGEAAGFLFEVYFVRFLVAIICFVLVFILMGRKFPISSPKSSDISN